MKFTSLGIDLLEKKPSRYLPKGKKTRVGILCHPASVSSSNTHLFDIIEKSAQLSALFGPQHGIQGETQDNMIEWQDQVDSKGRPVYSLYGERRRPTQQSLKGLDLMVIDLFDVGSRYYTFIYTMLYMLEECGQAKVPVLICDRPNPLGGDYIEGPLLNLEYQSFVGLFELPICHGMTIGELAQLFCSKMANPPQLKIIALKNWKRSQAWDQLGKTWTLPSPNMPNFEAARVYPGMCLLEGTSLSEGRGTTRPFELIGAPFFDWDRIEKDYRVLCKSLRLEVAIHFHRQGFIPTFHKYTGQLCKGALQICTKPKAFRPYRHMAILLSIFRVLYKDQWKWKDPPYEYEYTKLPVDILAGGPELRLAVDEGKPLKSLFQKWQKDEESFRKLRKPFLIY